MRKRKREEIKQKVKLIDEIWKIQQFWIMIITLERGVDGFSERGVTGVDNLIFLRDLVIGCWEKLESQINFELTLLFFSKHIPCVRI